MLEAPLVPAERSEMIGAAKGANPGTLRVLLYAKSR